MKHTYTIEDLMRAFNKSRPTIWRWHKKGAIPKPDIHKGANPLWTHKTIGHLLPNQNTSAST